MPGLDISDRCYCCCQDSLCKRLLVQHLHRMLRSTPTSPISSEGTLSSDKEDGILSSHVNTIRCHHWWQSCYHSPLHCGTNSLSYPIMSIYQPHHTHCHHPTCHSRSPYSHPPTTRRLTLYTVTEPRKLGTEAYRSRIQRSVFERPARHPASIPPAAPQNVSRAPHPGDIGLVSARCSFPWVAMRLSPNSLLKISSS